MDKIPGELARHEQLSGQIAFMFGIAIVLFAPLGHLFKSYFFLTESLFAMLVGILFSAQGFGWFPIHDLPIAKDVFLELTRLVIVNTNYLKQHWKEMLRLLAFAMAPMWLASSLCVYIVFRHDVLMCLIVGGCLAPTDPVLSSTVVKGKFAEKHLHAVVRESLTAESGGNDGLALPFIMLPLLLMKYGGGYAVGVWLYKTILYRVVLAIILGVALGACVAIGVSVTSSRGFADRETKLILLVAVSVLAMGLSLLIGVDEFIACFSAGIAYNFLDHSQDKTDELQIDDATDTIACFTFFGVFGTIIPWKGIENVGVDKLLVLSVLLIFLRRLPFIPLLKAAIFNPGRSLTDTVTIGYFGPIGAGAVFWALFVEHEFEAHNITDSNNLFDIVCFVVLTQTVLYGLTTPFASRWYDYSTGYSNQELPEKPTLEETALSVEASTETKQQSEMPLYF